MRRGGVKYKVEDLHGGNRPEMFILITGGRIVPNGALPRGGGTTVVNQKSQFYNWDTKY